MRPFDKSGNFRPTAGGDTLQRLAVQGAGVTVFSQGLGFAVQTIATVVLARLLTPNDFGLVTMVTTFSLLLVSFGPTGFTEAVLQRTEIDHSLISNLFWINFGSGLLLTVAFASMGSILAHFYRDPRVTDVAITLSLTILFTSLSVQHLALLKRAMRFTAVSANDVIARAVSVTVAIFLGWRGYGYWALAAGAMALPLSTTIGAWILCPWIPSLPRPHHGVRSTVWFAMHTYGRYVLGYFTNNVDNLLVGWRLGPIALGFYKKAYDLFLLPASQTTAPLTPVVLSSLSRWSTHDPGQHRKYFLNMLGIMALAGMGLGGLLTLVGKDLIYLMLGPQWGTAGRIFTFFGPGIGIMLLYHTHGWIHLSIGRADRSFRWAIIEFTTTCLLFIWGLRWGAVGVALAWTISYWTLTIPAFWYAGRPIRLGVGPIVASVWRYVAASVIAAGASIAILREIPFPFAATPAMTLVHILMVCSIFGSLYLCAVIALHWGIAPLHQFATLWWHMFPGRFIKARGEIEEPVAEDATEEVLASTRATKGVGSVL